MIHDPIRPSIEQLWRQWRLERFLSESREYLHNVQDDCAKREKLWTQFEESQDAMRAIQSQVLARLDAKFGPGMGLAVKEILGG